MENLFSIQMQVRDYECDIQGIVNNSVYMNYLEHARHEYIMSLGIDFAALHVEGIDPVVVNANMNYKASLRPKDRFAISVEMEKEGRFRYKFIQKIHKLEDQSAIMDAVITAAVLKNGRPISMDEFDRHCKNKEQ